MIIRATVDDLFPPLRYSLQNRQNDDGSRAGYLSFHGNYYTADHLSNDSREEFPFLLISIRWTTCFTAVKGDELDVFSCEAVVVVSEHIA